MNNEVKSIRYGFHGADLMNGWDEEELEKYDPIASAERYADMVKRELKRVFPNALSVDVVFDHDAGGALPRPMWAAVNEFTDSADVGLVEHIAGNVYQDFEWLVERGME